MNLILSKKGIIPKAQFIFPSKFDFRNVHEFFKNGRGGGVVYNMANKIPQ